MSNEKSHSADILILGGGAAGLSAATALTRQGISSLILEARDRLGGRILTVRDPRLQAPIELGAEFIHGLPPQIWEIAQAENVDPVEVSGDDWCFRQGKLLPCEVFSETDELLSQLRIDRPDESFADFLNREGTRFHEEAREWALGYVTGFQAGDPEKISVHSLVRSGKADEKIEGHRAFRLPGGYGWLVEYFRQQLERSKVPVQLNTIVEKVEWDENEVKVCCQRNGRAITYRAKHALITLPLGVLKSGDIKFSPDLPSLKRNAMESLTMGKVVRLTLCFRERFWDHIHPEPASQNRILSDLSFLFSRQPWFPTWWTTMPRKLPILTAWAPFCDAEQLAGRSQDFVVSCALDSLALLLEQSRSDLRDLLDQAYYHNWEKDPFSRGAYSYVCVGGDQAEEKLGRPVGDRLFFAGEATDASGQNGTVHGAIASGHRAAREIALVSK